MPSATRKSASSKSPRKSVSLVRRRAPAETPKSLTKSASSLPLLCNRLRLEYLLLRRTPCHSEWTVLTAFFFRAKPGQDRERGISLLLPSRLRPPHCHSERKVLTAFLFRAKPGQDRERGISLQLRSERPL